MRRECWVSVVFEEDIKFKIKNVPSSYWSRNSLACRSKSVSIKWIKQLTQSKNILIYYTPVTELGVENVPMNNTKQGRAHGFLHGLHFSCECRLTPFVFPVCFTSVWCFFLKSDNDYT